MDGPPIPQKPKSSHIKKTSKISVRTIGRETDQEERDRDPAGRRKLQPLRTNLGSTRGAVELLPEPNDDARDPLNWPTWRKEFAFWSLILTTAVVSMLKTLYVPTNFNIATDFSCSYMAAAALTGLPFMFAALSGLGTTVMSQVIGKRIVYIASGALMLIGTMWNMQVLSSYAQFMGSRLFQGIGWGATEALVVVSIRDMYSIPQRGLRMNIYNIATLLFTWGSPIAGGYLSQTNDSFRQEIMVVTIIQAFSVLFLIILVPETSFTNVPTLGLSNKITGPAPSGFKAYLSTLKPLPFRQQFSLSSALPPLRSLGAPTTILTFLATFPLIATAHGIANSLALLFGAMPTFLFPGRLGYLFILPVFFSLITYSLVSFTSRFRRSFTFSMVEVLLGILLGVSGLLAFGLYTVSELSPKTVTSGTTVFQLDATADNISLKVVSALFGMLVAGSAILSFSASQHLSPPPSSKTSDLETGHRFMESVFTGIFIIAMPSWIQMVAVSNVGLKNTSIALAVLAIILGSSAGAVLVCKGMEVGRLDGRVLGRRLEGVPGSLELKGWESRESFLDA